MKKTLVALAVSGLAASSAIAQVTIYGNLETGILNTDTDGKAATTKLDSSIVNSSRLGFRGTEDLGGGMKAFFRLETSMDAEVGKGMDSFNRGSEVGLSGAFGAVKVGKFDITGAEGIDSAVSLIGNYGNASGIDIGSDINHAIQYTSPKIGNFEVQLGTALSDGGVNETVSVFVGGSVAKIKVGFGSTTDKDSKGVERTATTMGAQYDFGPVAASAYYGVREADNAGEVTNTIFTAKAPIGSGFSVHGMIGTFKTDAFGTKAASETEEMTLAVSKAFSKRTTGYLGYQTSDKDGVETNNLYLAVNHKF